MLIGLLLLVSSLSSPDPVASAVESYAGVDSYSVTIDSRGESGRELFRYYFKRPGFVRMEFIEPHNGAVIVYSPMTKKARVRPFGSLKGLAVTLSPGNMLIRSSRGHTVDASDLGVLFKYIERLEKGGVVDVRPEEEPNGRSAVPVSVEGPPGKIIDGIHRYMVWFDSATHMPVRAVSYGEDGRVIEDVLMDDMVLNVRFPEGFFEID